jgi:hypothetical protein
MLGRVAEAVQDGEILRREMTREEFARFEVLLSGQKKVRSMKQLWRAENDN